MSRAVNHTNLHRTAKYFMDSGRAASHDEALAMLESYGLNVVLSADAASTFDGQIALLTLVNLARRTFLGGVYVIGIGNAANVTILSKARSLAEAVEELGGLVADGINTDYPVAVIGEPTLSLDDRAGWKLCWQGWRGGVVPRRDTGFIGTCIPLAPALAAAVCVAELFQFFGDNHPMAGRRSAGISLWRPERDWLEEDDFEPSLSFLPSRLWLIGLGNLGQAYAWLLATLPYVDRKAVELVLQDFDRLAVSNDSTSLLATLSGVDEMKTRWVSSWLEQRGFSTFIEERYFGPWTSRSPTEPAVALCGVDNGPTRAALENAGFDLVVEAGLGAGPQSFRSFSMHCFPGSKRADELWSAMQDGKVDVTQMPAYAKLKESGLDECGLTQLASRTVGVPYVGLLAALLVISELLRRLHGSDGIDLASGSAAALEDIEVCWQKASVYAFGHLSAAA